MPFDRNSHIALDILYFMEQEKIPVLTKLMYNQVIRSTVCSENSEAVYKWPTFTKLSLYEPTWEKLYLILRLVDMNDQVKMIKRYLKKMKGTIIIMCKASPLSDPTKSSYRCTTRVCVLCIMPSNLT